MVFEFEATPIPSPALSPQCLASFCLIADSQQQSFDTDIFVNFIPMEPGPSPADFISGPLFLCCIKKSGEIGQRNTQPTTVG